MACSYKHDFFVSYPHVRGENILKEFVDCLAATIRYLRTDDELADPVYVDSKRLEPGFQWARDLDRALCHSRCLLAIYTDVYFTREYCCREWEAMAELELKRVGRPIRSMIIPILFRAKEGEDGRPSVPPQVQGLQYEDFRHMYSPKTQFETIRVRKRVDRLLKRIHDLRNQSPDPVVDCDTFGALALPVAPLPLAQEEYGGSWTS